MTKPPALVSKCLLARGGQSQHRAKEEMRHIRAHAGVAICKLVTMRSRVAAGGAINILSQRMEPLEAAATAAWRILWPPLVASRNPAGAIHTLKRIHKLAGRNTIDSRGCNRSHTLARSPQRTRKSARFIYLSMQTSTASMINLATRMRLRRTKGMQQPLAIDKRAADSTRRPPSKEGTVSK